MSKVSKTRYQNQTIYFESMPKALPNRTNIVITRQEDYTAEDAHIVHSLEAALALAQEDPIGRINQKMSQFPIHFEFYSFCL